MLNRPSVVRLLSNPTPTQSIYEWVPTNVKSMNRSNKLSSVPFYVPNDKERKHQFRLVLLRGVVKGPSDDKDPIAVYVEYLPPSIDGQPVEPPGTCTLSIWCVNRFAEESDRREQESDEAADAKLDGPTRGAPHRYDETTFTFTATERMTGFKELVPYTDLEDEAMVDPTAFNAMTIRLQVTTGVTSVAEVVAKTTDRWASSLWGSATSAFQALQTGLDVIKQQVMSTVDERSEGVATVAKELPWDELPQVWQKAGRTLPEWEKLIAHTIVEDEGTFLYGPNRGLHPDEQVLMTQVGLNHRAIMNAATLFDYDRDVHEGLLSIDAIRKQRYQLVPKVVKDTEFWGNYMWKVAALSTAPKDEQVLLLMSIVNAPPRVTAAKVKSPTQQAELLVAQYEKESAELLKQSFEATELLDELVADMAEEVLVTTARQSCKVCSDKLQDLLARLNNTTDNAAANQVPDAVVATMDVLKVTISRTIAQLQDAQQPRADKAPAAAAAAAQISAAAAAGPSLEVPSASVTEAQGNNERAPEVVPTVSAKENAEEEVVEGAEAEAEPEAPSTSAEPSDVDHNASSKEEERIIESEKEEHQPSHATTNSSFDVVDSTEAATTATTAVAAAASPKPAAPTKLSGSSKGDLDFLDEDFPELSASPTVGPSAVAGAKVPSITGSPQGTKEGSLASTRKIAFEPMPWDEDDE